MMKFLRTMAVTLVCLILGIIISWQYQSIRVNARVSSVETMRRSELETELLAEKRKNDALAQQLRELQVLNDSLENRTGQNDDLLKNLINEKNKFKLLAGLSTVKGKGVIITLKDTEDDIVEDYDILTVLNELRASDVQAMAINDERILATTEVRMAGRYIMVNGRQNVSPFVIKAIADPEKLEYSLKIMGGVVERLREYGLFVEVKQEENIIIPKAREDGSVIRYNLLQSIE